MTTVAPARPSWIVPGITLLGMVTGMGCGLGFIEDHSGGAEHLPTQGAGPYGKLAADLDTPADEPYVVSAFRVSLRDPAPLWRDDGGIRLWFGYEDADFLGQVSTIAYSELTDITELPDFEPIEVLVADQSWEQDWIGAPSVIQLSADELVMFYQGGLDSPAIGRADSSDGGMSWVKYENNPIISDGYNPSAVRLSDRGWSLFFHRAAGQGIYAATSADGTNWSVESEPVLAPRHADAGAYDRDALSSPHVTARRDAGGTLHYGLFFNGIVEPGENEVISVGWAGSFDGSEWRRFASPDEPALAPGNRNVHGPAVLLRPDRGIMFFNQLRQGVQSIAVAVHP